MEVNGHEGEHAPHVHPTSVEEPSEQLTAQSPLVPSEGTVGHQQGQSGDVRYQMYVNAPQYHWHMHAGGETVLRPV